MPTPPPTLYERLRKRLSDRLPTTWSSDLWRYFSSTAERIASNGSKAKPSAISGAATSIAGGIARSRTAVRTRHARRKAQRLDSNIGRPGDAKQSIKGLDPLAETVARYLCVFGVTVVALEGSGTYSALAVFDATLGTFRVVLAIACGMILFLAGHLIGHELRQSEGRSRRYTAMLVAPLLVTAVFAVSWTGLDRAANEQARALMAEAGSIGEQVRQLEDRAAELQAPVFKSKADKRTKPPSPEDLARADALLARADVKSEKQAEMEAKAGGARRLNFLAAVQVAGIFVGILGGFGFAGGEAARWDRSRRKVASLETKVQSIEDEELAHAQASLAHLAMELAMQNIDISSPNSAWSEKQTRALVQSRNGHNKGMVSVIPEEE